MKRMTTELWVGTFVLTAVVLVILFAAVKGQIAFRKAGYEIQARFGYVAGLDRGSPVRVSGVRVGEVRQVLLSYEQQPVVYLTLRLDHSVKLGRHSQFLIRSFGLIGEKYLEIIPTSVTDTPVIQPGEVVSGTEPMPLDRLLVLGEELGRSAKNMVDSIEVLVGDPKLKKQILDTLDAVEGLAEESRLTLTDVKSASHSFQSASDRAEELLSAAKTTLTDLQPRLFATLVSLQLATASVQKAGEEVTAILTRAQSPESSLGPLLSSPEVYQKLEKSLTSLEEATDQFQRAARDLAQITADIEAGKGSVGQLLTSDELYQEVKGFVSEIRAKPWRLLRPDR